MDTEPRTLANADLPLSMRSLPRNAQGYPIPWFVATLDDGSRDFRVADMQRRYHARTLRLCWVCGKQLGAYNAFVLGPMCAVNRVTAEPPCHRECAIYSARVCPFLAVPQMRRRTTDLPDDVVDPAGDAILRNPGVALVWITRSFSVRQAPMGGKGLLWHLGDPTSTLWYAHGREATRAEVLASVESGLPILEAACLKDDDPATSLVVLDADYRRTLALLPP